MLMAVKFIMEFAPVMDLQKVAIKLLQQLKRNGRLAQKKLFLPGAGTTLKCKCKILERVGETDVYSLESSTALCQVRYTKIPLVTYVDVMKCNTIISAETHF